MEIALKEIVRGDRNRRGLVGEGRCVFVCLRDLIVFICRELKSTKEESESPEKTGMIDKRRSQDTWEGMEPRAQENRFNLLRESSVHLLTWKRRQGGWAPFLV